MGSTIPRPLLEAERPSEGRKGHSLPLLSLGPDPLGSRRRGRPSFVFSLKLKDLGPHSPCLRLPRHLGAPRLKPESASHRLLLSLRATIWGASISFLPLSPAEPEGQGSGLSATPTQGLLAFPLF